MIRYARPGQELLEVVNYDVLQALDIRHAGTPIDARVTGFSMHGDDGIMLIRHAGNLLAILLTRYAEQLKSAASTVSGFFHVLRKPVESRRLIEQLHLLVDIARA